jgi:hypothetical protein
MYYNYTRVMHGAGAHATDPVSMVSESVCVQAALRRSVAHSEEANH